MTELIIVMPVFNEQASVAKVVREWFLEVQKTTKDFIFLAINDGSTDKTLEFLSQLRDKFGDRFEIKTHKNIGHGQSCLVGYRIACSRGIPYVFQIDSDGQCDPQYFYQFWNVRRRYDVIYGHRTRRDDGWRRVIASQILRIVLFTTCGVNCMDANSPYRMMKTCRLAEKISMIPDDFFLANVGLAVLLRECPLWSHGLIPIRFRKRYGGEPSVKLRMFAIKAFELIKQLKKLKDKK